MAKATVLVIEDEGDLLEVLEFNLRRAGFEVLRAEEGRSGLCLALERAPDILVLDLMLPGMDGKEICRRLRRDPATRNMPIIMLTALATEKDRIIGLELGADDYLTKPFSPRELVLRVEAILRRTGEPAAGAGSPLRRGELAIDPQRHLVTVAGNPLDLTVTEFRLLCHLVRRAGRVQTREVLLDKVWGYAYQGYARTVDTHIRRLRRKLGPLSERIETVRGIGYRYQDLQPGLNLLFLCTGNSCRSQMAEAWTQKLKGAEVAAYSAGVSPQGLDPRAVTVMAEAGLDISGRRAKAPDRLQGVEFHWVVTLCERARQECPYYPGAVKRLHLPLPDPPRLAAGAGSEEEALGFYRQVRDEIRRFVQGLPQNLQSPA